jgi:hypothetical protein
MLLGIHPGALTLELRVVAAHAGPADRDARNRRRNGAQGLDRSGEVERVEIPLEEPDVADYRRWKDQQLRYLLDQRRTAGRRRSSSRATGPRRTICAGSGCASSASPSTARRSSNELLRSPERAQFGAAPGLLRGIFRTILRSLPRRESSMCAPTAR